MAENTKPRFHFEEENTEGHHETAFRFDNTEIKKGEYAVATHLRDLYDCDVITVPPVDGDVLKFDGSQEKWVPGQAGGSCDLIRGEIFLHVRYKVVHTSADNSYERFNYKHGNYQNGEVINPDPDNPIGTFDNPFAEIADAIQWVQNNCRTISDEARINIMVYSDEVDPNDSDQHEIPLHLSWKNNGATFNDRFFCEWRQANITYPYAHRIFIYGVNDPPETGVEDVSDWINDDAFHTPLNVRYRAIIYCDSGCVGWTEFEYATRRFQDFVKIDSGLTLGGIYNFAFREPFVEINCHASSGDGG